MTDEQKRYIEDNIELIETDNWGEFFKFAPYGAGAILYEAGIPFLEKLGYISNSAFEGSNIQTIDIPDNVTSIESHAFACCRDLTSVIIPDSVTKIDTFAFYNCTRLTSVNIPNNVTTISNHAFCNCYSLTSINISDGVTTIGEKAFYNCTTLTTVSIPNSVKWVGGTAFENCGNINIDHNGTIAEWKTLIGNNSRVFKNTTYTCNCIDGVVKKLR